MSKAPSMPMFWDAYLADTTHLSTEEHGAYLLILAAMWRRDGTVPDDDKDNARILGLTVAKWRKIKARLAPFLVFEDGFISQKNLQKIWKKTQEKIEKNAQNGAKGGKAKSNNNKDLSQANATNSLKRKATIPEPEPEPYIKKETKVSQKRGSRLPDDWSLSEKNISDAQAQGLTTDEVRHEADKFRDYWISTAGAKGVKLDWDATWRNWCRNASKRTSQRPSRNAGPQSMADALAELRDDIERAERGGGTFSEGPSGHDGATIIELTPVGRGNGHRAQTGQQDGYGDGFGPDWVLPGQGFR